MVKKQLSLLAGSILVASGANALTVGDLTTGGSAILVLNDDDFGSYVYDTNISALQLSQGQGFSLDISGALTDANFSLDSYAVFGIVGGPGASLGGGVYSYDGGGLVYAQSAAGSLAADANQLNTWTQGIIDWLNQPGGAASATDSGLFIADGSPSNFFNNAAANGGAGGLLTGGLTGLFFQTMDAGGNISQNPVDILNPDAAQEGVYIQGSNFNVTNELTVIPVPAAAWLFGSALVGLGVIRRRKET